MITRTKWQLLMRHGTRCIIAVVHARVMMAMLERHAGKACRRHSSRSSGEELVGNTVYRTGRALSLLLIDKGLGITKAFTLRFDAILAGL